MSTTIMWCVVDPDGQRVRNSVRDGEEQAKCDFVRDWSAGALSSKRWSEYFYAHGYRLRRVVVIDVDDEELHK